jgi:hypothetical protein
VKSIRGHRHAAVVGNSDEGPEEIEVEIPVHWGIKERDGSH